MPNPILGGLRALALGALFVTVPLAAHAHESEPGAPGTGVGVEVEITPTETAVDPTDPPTTDPTTTPAEDPTGEPTTPPAQDELGRTGFTGLPVLIGAGALVVAGCGVLVHRRRATA